MILVTWFVSVNIQNPAIDYAKGLWVLFRFLCQNLRAWSNRIVKIVRRDGRPRPILCVLFGPFFSLTTAEVPQSRRESKRINEYQREGSWWRPQKSALIALISSLSRSNIKRKKRHSAVILSLVNRYYLFLRCNPVEI